MNTAFLIAAILLSSASCFEDKSISQWLTDNGFTDLVKDLKAANLYSMLNGGGPYTVFAPTNAAFAKLQNATIDNFAANPEVLKTVLKYHVIDGFIVGPQVMNGVVKASLNGQALKFSKAPDNTLYVGNSTISKGDNILNNGVVHVIDTVLMPLTNTISEVLMKDQARFSDLLLLLSITDLFGPLMKGSYTLFAPTNDAFRALQDHLPEFGDPKAKKVYEEILKNHIVNGTYFARNLHSGLQLPTLHGAKVRVSVNAPNVTVDHAGVIQADLMAVNGVIHVINQLIVPGDMP